MIGGLEPGFWIMVNADLADNPFGAGADEIGVCDRGYRYPVRILNGTLASAGDTAITITVKVAGSGAITVTVSAGGRSATGSGRLAGKVGMGSWSGGSCSGSWSAERRGS